MVQRGRRRSGFTLIELVVVLVILAAVAALLVPKLGFLKEQADSATGAAGGAQVVSNLETYKVSAGGYPAGLDTLLESGGSAVYSKLWKHTSGGGSFGLGATDLTVATVGSGYSGSPPNGYAVSFGHAFALPNDPSTGVATYYFYDHDAASTDPSNSGTELRTFTSASSQNVAHVAPTATSLIRAAGYPAGTLPAGVKLIAFGIGPNNAAVGKSMTSAPRHTGQSEEYYGRFIAIFAVYASGKGAELKTVVDSTGASIESNISSYRRSGPEVNELPVAPTP